MHHTEITKALGQVPPWDTGAVTVEHRINKQPVVSCSGSGLSSLAGQQVFDAQPMRIAQGISSGHAQLHGLCCRAFK